MPRQHCWFGGFWNIISLLLVLYRLHENGWLPAANLSRLARITLIGFHFGVHIQIASWVARIGSLVWKMWILWRKHIISCQNEIHYNCFCALQRDLWMLDMYFHDNGPQYGMLLTVARHKPKCTFMFIGCSLLGTTIKFHDVAQIITHVFMGGCS